MEDANPEEVNTDANIEGVLLLIRDRCERALDPEDDTDRKHTLQNIRDVCDALADE